MSKIHIYIGNAVAITIAAMFVLNGYDIVSYFYRKFEMVILKWVLKQEVLAAELLPNLGEHTHFSEM